MAVTVKVISGVKRIVDVDTGRIARSSGGMPKDGGRANASVRDDSVTFRQAMHINQGIIKKSINAKVGRT